MTIGDCIRLHVSGDHREALHMPEGVGILREVDMASNHPALLISFGDLVVYTSALSEAEIEIVVEGACEAGSAL